MTDDNRTTCQSCGVPWEDHLGIQGTCQRHLTAQTNVEAYAAAARVIHLHLRAFCDESLPFDEMIAEASRKAALCIEQERHQAEVYRKQYAEAEKRVSDLRVSIQAFASCVLSVRKNNTEEWMDWIAGTVNDVCEMLGTGDRFQFDGRGGLKRVNQ